MHAFSCVGLKAHQQGHRPSGLNTAGDHGDVLGFPGSFLVNLYTVLQLLTEMGRRIFTLLLVVPARPMSCKMQRPHTALAGLEDRSRSSIIQEKNIINNLFRSKVLDSEVRSS